MLRIACGSLLLLACQATTSCPVADGANCKFWSYRPVIAGDTIFNCGDYANNTCGPNLWGGVSPDSKCGNVGDQSPVNITTSNSTSVTNSASTDFALSGPTHAITSALNTCGTSGEFAVSGSTLSVNIPTACQTGFAASLIRTPGVAAEVYNLASYSFHAPSEHTVDGTFFDMEAQFVHTNAAGSSLILAVFMKGDAGLKAKCTALSGNHAQCKRADFFASILLGGMTQAALTAGVAGLGGPPAIFRHTNAATAVNPYPPHFIPPMTSHFYTYNGSLTTPPCTPGATWVLHPTPVFVYSTSVALYKTIVSSYVNNQLTASTATPFASANNRPAQAWGMRKLYYHGQIGRTFLTAAVAAGATTIQTLGTAGFVVGESIIIGPNTPHMETNKVSSFGSIVLASPTQFAHPIGTVIRSMTTTSPGVTVTPAAGAVTTTPAATVTPIVPIRRYSENKVTAKEGNQWASNTVCLGVGCLIGMTVLAAVQGFRSRMQKASSDYSIAHECEDGEANLLQSLE